MTSLNAPPRSTGTPDAPAAGRSSTTGRRLLFVTGGAAGGAALTGLLTVVAHPWYLPFLAGLLLGALRLRSRLRSAVIVLLVVVTATGGWTLALLWRVWSGEPVAGVASVTAALAGLPPSPALIVTVTLLIALLQGLCGAWLALSLARLVRSPTSKQSEPEEAP